MKSSLSRAKEKLEKDQIQILPLMGFELLNMEPAQGTGFDSEEKTRSACAGGGGDVCDRVASFPVLPRALASPGGYWPWGRHPN